MFNWTAGLIAIEKFDWRKGWTLYVRISSRRLLNNAQPNLKINPPELWSVPWCHNPLSPLSRAILTHCQVNKKYRNCSLLPSKWVYTYKKDINWNHCGGISYVCDCQGTVLIFQNEWAGLSHSSNCVSWIYGDWPVTHKACMAAPQTFGSWLIWDVDRQQCLILLLLSVM